MPPCHCRILRYFLIIFRREDTGYRSSFDVTFTLTSQVAVTTTTAPKLQPGVAKAVNSPAYALSVRGVQELAVCDSIGAGSVH